MNAYRKIVLLAAAVLFLVWGFLNIGRLTGDQEGLIRIVLGVILSLAILLRWKPAEEGLGRRPWLAPTAGIVGALLVVAGIVFRVHQFEWLGIILLLYACLIWALPPYFARDIALSLLLLYWVHPLPGQVFGSFQLAMQGMSVRGAEWLLHCLNVRVWADGLMLNTGLRVFGVPEACSGMRTAVTVFLCTLGVCVLLRHRWRSTVFLVAAGLVQVLLLNILRITLVVFFAPRMPEEWADTALHDTAGLFLLVSIVLTQIEVSWWKIKEADRRRIAEGHRSGSVERPERAFKAPRFWHVARKIGPRLVLVVVVLMFLAAGAYKSRPSHRRIMRTEVIDLLMDHDRDTAFRAVECFLAERPDDRNLLSKKAQILVSRGEYEAALRTLDSLPGELEATEKVAKSWALMALKKPEEAVAVIETLPDNIKRVPSVAIIRAQYGALMGNLGDVVENIVIAANSHRALERVRALFPYLALHEQWEVIAACDRGPDYGDITHALIALQARLKAGPAERAGEICRKGIEKWPDDPRFLPGLFALALSRPGGEWEGLLAEGLKRNLGRLDADQLALFMNYAFRLSRPDLGWIAYCRLREIDARDPELLIMPARFGDVWLRFQRNRIGVGGRSREDLIDLAAWYRHTRDVWPMAGAWQRVPLADLVTSADLERVKSDALEACLSELKERADKGLLNRRMFRTFVDALASGGKLEEAHRRLDEMIEAFPDLKASALLRHAFLYSGEKMWARSYESAREARTVLQTPLLQADLLLIDAMLNMNMGVCALDAAQRAVELYAGAAEAEIALASAWNFYGYSEQAYTVVSRRSWSETFPPMVQLLYDTGRRKEAEKKSRALGVPILKGKDEPREFYTLPPAELTLAGQWEEPLTDEAMDREAQVLAGADDSLGSVFLQALRQRTIAWYREHGEGAAGDLDAWEKIGRDDMEKGAAFHRLAVLLARQRRNKEAIEAAEAALVHMPRSAVLHRIMIALSEGEAERVAAALAACPDDPEIWLAGLVVDSLDEKARERVDRAVTGAIAAGRISVGTAVRAGDFMLRRGRLDAASRLARYALERAKGFLPAYALGLRCAVRAGDREWALKCAHEGIEQSGDPAVFYRCIAFLKDESGESDMETMRALEYLQQRFPEEAHWGTMLGGIYFERGDSKRALAVLSSIPEDSVAKADVKSLLMASEAARIEGDPELARRFLETGHGIYPDRVSILNNLVYNLAQQPATLARAKALLPKLLEVDKKSAGVLDTLAFVFFKTGDLDSAQKYSRQALAALEEDDYAALEIRLNAARIFHRAGNPGEAKRLLEAVSQDKRCSGRIEYECRRLLDQIATGPGDS